MNPKPMAETQKYTFLPLEEALAIPIEEAWGKPDPVRLKPEEMGRLILSDEEMENVKERARRIKEKRVRQKAKEMRQALAKARRQARKKPRKKHRDAGKKIETPSGDKYTIGQDGSYRRSEPKQLSKKERARIKRERKKEANRKKRQQREELNG